jgi:hypothetical protein
MLEINGNILDYFPNKIPAIAVTTNGLTDSRGNAIMGKGIAKQAKERYPRLPKILGEMLIEFGNRVHLIDGRGEYLIYSFPTKTDWKYKSNIRLIGQSSIELMNEMNYHKIPALIMTRPGCGNGGLDWDYVKPMIQDILDDRMFIISP